MRRFAVIVAGGKGSRMGSDLPKQFIPLCGKPILMHTLERFHEWDPSADLIVVLPAEQFSYWKMLCREIDCQIPHQLAEGGATRFHSVKNGLLLIARQLESEGCDARQAVVGIHDGVRPFVSTEVIESCFATAEEKGTAVPVTGVVDSLREGTMDESHPVNRDRYFAVQTPQVFRADLLLHAYHQEYITTFTDDASVIEADGHRITTVLGNRENIKITTPSDLKTAEALLNPSIY